MNILIVEDEPVIRQELEILLKNALYEVTALREFGQVPADILRIDPDLVLLDLNLPGESGFDICVKVRIQSDVPVIFLTSRTDSADELNGMITGGDDYITKPFYPPVLLARIAAVLKRAKKDSDRELSRLQYKGVKLHLAKGCVTFGEKSAELTKNEMKILHCLFQRQGEFVPRADMIEYLWDNQVYIDDNSLSVNVTRLRNKLGSMGLGGFIETKRGMGYRI
ncbi:MAG: response regulator transcription factor [Dorea sp.]|nr:response regulator transcription factor [Dorea sp.]